MSSIRSTLSPRRWSRSWLPVAAVFVLSVCKNPVVYEFDLSPLLLATPDTLEGAPGQTVRSRLSTNGLAGSSTMSLSSASGSDLVATFTPGQLTADAPTAEMVIAIPASATPSGRLLTSRVDALVSGSKLVLDRTVYVRVLPPPSISASVDPTGITVLRGATGSATLSVTRNGGYAGDLSVQVEGLPSGVSVGGTTIGTGTRATLTFTVPSTAPVGVSVLRFTVRGDGVAPQTVPFALTIADPPGFSLTAATAAQTITQGTTGDGVGVAITRRGGFGGAVALSVGGLPTGVSATVTAPGTGNSGLVTFGAAATAAKGTYSLTLRASAEGVPGQSVPFSLTVAEPGGFTLSPETASQLVTAGASAPPVRVAVSRQGGFAGAVTLDVGPLPSGVTVTRTNPGTGTMGSFAFTASTSAVAGRYELNVVGTAAGVREVSVPFALIVAAAPAVALTLDAPSSLQVTRGGSSDATIGVFRTGWTGAVALEVSGAPAGITATMVPASTTANFSVLRLSIGGNVALGTYTLQIRGTGANGTTATTTVGVTVQP